MDELDKEGRHGTTAVNAFELFYGAQRSAQRAVNTEKSIMLLSRLEVLPLDLESAHSGGAVLADLATRGETIDFRDAMIAGIAKVNGLVLLTRNRDHFARVKGLSLEDW